MTIQVYDGNNVLIRALLDKSLHAANSISLRMRYNQLKAHDIWVFDGFGHNRRRQDIFPAYKAHRPPLAMDIMAQIKLFKTLIGYSSATMIECLGWEADDVINTLAQSGRPMKIHTNDMDYAQLADLPNVTLNGVKTKDVPARWVPLYKALVGDPADNIPGIPGFGPKSWKDLGPHLENFSRMVLNGQPGSVGAYPIAPRIENWLRTPGNFAQLQDMLAITQFMLVPEDEINAGITVGTPDPAAVNELLTRYLL
jgi:hypothetical protein